MRTAKTDQTGQTESSLDARVILFVLSCGGSFVLQNRFLRAHCPSIFSSIAIELNVPCGEFTSIAIELLLQDRQRTFFVRDRTSLLTTDNALLYTNKS